MSVQQSANSLAGASADAIRYHYDVGTEFYRLWLDSEINYSAARWSSLPGLQAGATQSLEDAQTAKLDFHLDAVEVGKGHRLLDVGCGWGSLIKRALLSREVAHATALTLSQDQYDYVAGLALPNTDLRLQSYTDYEPELPFDAVISIGAFEHFSHPEMELNAKIAAYRGFFERCQRWLVRRGKLSLQTITWGGAIPRSATPMIMAQDVFPETDPPYIEDVVAASKDSFELLYMENRREDYVRTLQVWLARLRDRRAEATAMIGEEGFVFYDRYLRRSIYGFKKKELQLCRFVFQAL